LGDRADSPGDINRNPASRPRTPARKSSNGVLSSRFEELPDLSDDKRRRRRWKSQKETFYEWHLNLSNVLADK
jgi:hypothetical protein